MPGLLAQAETDRMRALARARALTHTHARGPEWHECICIRACTKRGARPAPGDGRDSLLERHAPGLHGRHSARAGPLPKKILFQSYS